MTSHLRAAHKLSGQVPRYLDATGQLDARRAAAGIARTSRPPNLPASGCQLAVWGLIRLVRVHTCTWLSHVVQHEPVYPGWTRPLQQA